MIEQLLSYIHGLWCDIDIIYCFQGVEGDQKIIDILDAGLIILQLSADLSNKWSKLMIDPTLVLPCNNCLFTVLSALRSRFSCEFHEDMHIITDHQGPQKWTELSHFTEIAEFIKVHGNLQNSAIILPAVSYLYSWEQVSELLVGLEAN